MSIARWISRRLWIAGFSAGLLLVALDGLLPAGVQSVILYAGIALILLSVGTKAALLARGAHLEWRGMSPVVGIAVVFIGGVVPFVQRAPWSHSDAERTAVSAITTPSAPTRARAPIPSAPPSQGAAESESPAGSKRAAVLAEVAGLLEQKARPALDGQRRYLISLLQDRTATRDPARVRTGLASDARQLGEVESSLETIKSQNRDLSKELDAVIGDARPLTALNSSLREVSDSSAAESGDLGNPVIRLRQLATENMVANQWVTSVDRRVADARAVNR